MGRTQSIASRKCHGARSEKKGTFRLMFPRIVHCAEAASYACSMQSPPAPGALFSLVFLSVPSALLYILSNVGHLIFHGQFHSQKETWISYRLDEVPQIYFFLYCKSTIPEDPGAKRCIPDRYVATFYWCRVFAS